MMFNVGDKVKVKENLKIEEQYNHCNFTNGMGKLRGKVFTIRKVELSPQWGVARYKMEGSDYYFSDGMLEKVENKQQEVINDINMFKTITSELCNTYQRKNADYGNSFAEQFNEYGMISSCIRLEDKLRRAKQLTKGVAKVEDEKLEDTLLDMANYAIMTVIELRKQHNTQEE